MQCPFWGGVSPHFSAVKDGFLLALGYTKLCGGNLLSARDLRGFDDFAERLKVIRAANLLIRRGYSV